MTRICISRRQQNFATAATADCFRMTSRNKNKTDQLVECKRQQKQKLTTTTTTTTTNVIRIFFAEFLQVFSFKVLTEIAKRIGTRQRPSKLMKRTDLKCKHCKKEIWLSSCAPTFWRYTFWVMLPVTSVWFPRVQATKWFANPYKEGKALARRC